MDKRQLLIKRLVLGAVLSALVIILQMIGQFIRIGPFSISLVLVPIVIGAALGGIGVSIWLGFVFSTVVILTDASAFLAINPLATVVVVFLKGIGCALVSALIYKIFEKKHPNIGIVSSSIICPIINTGIFVLGCFLFFFSNLSDWGIQSGYNNTFEYILIGMVGVNFLIELGVNAILSPVIIRIINISKLRKS